MYRRKSCKMGRFEAADVILLSSLNNTKSIYFNKIKNCLLSNYYLYSVVVLTSRVWNQVQYLFYYRPTEKDFKNYDFYATTIFICKKIFKN